MSPLNRRISIIVMNREAEDRFFSAANGESVPPEAVDGGEESDSNSSRTGESNR